MTRISTQLTRATARLFSTRTVDRPVRIFKLTNGSNSPAFPLTSKDDATFPEIWRTQFKLSPASWKQVNPSKEDRKKIEAETKEMTADKVAQNLKAHNFESLMETASDCIRILGDYKKTKEITLKTLVAIEELAKSDSDNGRYQLAIAESHNFLAYCAQFSGETEAAPKLFESALQAHTDSHSFPGLDSRYINLALSHAALGNYEKAENYLKSIISINNSKSESITYLYLGLATITSLHNPEEAFELYRGCLTHIYESPDTHSRLLEQIIAHNNAAITAHQLSRHGLATCHHEKSVEYCAQLDITANNNPLGRIVHSNAPMVTAKEPYKENSPLP